MKIERRRSRRVTIHVRVCDVERRRAEEAAAAAGVTLSDLIRAGMREATDFVLGRIPEQSSKS